MSVPSQPPVRILTEPSAVNDAPVECAEDELTSKHPHVRPFLYNLNYHESVIKLKEQALRRRSRLYGQTQAGFST